MPLARLMRSYLHSSALDPINSAGPGLVIFLFCSSLRHHWPALLINLLSLGLPGGSWYPGRSVGSFWGWSLSEENLQMFGRSCVWSGIPEMRLKRINLKLTPYLFSSAYAIMKATAIIFYGHWAHRIAVITNCWFFWGNFGKNYDIWESTIAVLQRLVRIG